ncbi:MAG: hypothetical protein GWO10_16690, partial [candidate division Zixibacteria bacterium]|nr:hypothetical protein [Phycisphaerae bacterium]NIR65361.1 hypothetical protein [candidate division Zixibacteria bacterium]NIW97518.1 hypothetical protein [Phycisphaerae bacterium]
MPKLVLDEEPQTQRAPRLVLDEPEREITSFPIAKRDFKVPWLMKIIAGGEDEGRAIMKSNLFRTDPDRAR